MFDAVPTAVFEALAQPTRRRLLDRLRAGPCLVGELAAELGLTQPATSKHLKVLRDAGLVDVAVEGPARRYRLRAAPLVELDEWLQPYRWMWEANLDRLGHTLDRLAQEDDA